LPEDWRYKNIQYLRGSKFRLARYEAPSAEWDHDHCKGCWAKFGSLEGPDILQSGYVTRTPSVESPEPEMVRASKETRWVMIPEPEVQGFHSHWLCPKCFGNFRDVLEFQLEP